VRNIVDFLTIENLFDIFLNKGEQCTEDYDCLTAYAICVEVGGKEICQCQDGFEPTANNAKCQVIPGK